LENILSISNLNKQYTNSRALDNVSLQVPAGSIFGLLGPNGAGKTTLLRIINNILSKDSGSVLINGQEAGWNTSHLLGYMPEERGLYEKMRVVDQIRYFGRLKGMDIKTINSNMEEYLEIFNLTADRNRRIKELSKGNQQKVQIVATIVHQPALVILDEPFSGFDPINSHLLTQLIERLRDKGTTVMLSSHNMAAVESMCTHIALIDHGHVLLNGKLNEIKNAHKNGMIKIGTNCSLPTTLLEDKSLISIISGSTQEENGSFSYTLKAAENISNNDLLLKLTYYTEILHFEMLLPSLEDIFLSYTIGNTETEANAK